ncbi:MAG: chromosome segregation protein SMC, partial [Lachnospiraceae bacterium]|nr:chromosome segregation protein SMC [Lachnospiraceae bacterium]
KSNVADAVRWVLGEQSAKQLRGNSMQDVIFSGTEMRKPQGFAYVSITFDNTDHALAIDYEEVTVARRVYRSGESEYLLNGSVCRLKDVQELFFDTGIGKEGYSIIGQGQIDRIVSGRPEERRELLDEAAGIVKFKKRKTIAEKNLEQEQANLARVEDILAELEKQIEPLEKQSEKAREYLKYKEELKSVEVNQFLLMQEKGSVAEGELGKAKGIVSGDLAETKKNYEDTKGEYEKLEKELEEAACALDTAKEERNELSLICEREEGDIRLLSGQIESIEQNSRHFEQSMAKADGDLAEKEEELSRYLLEKQGIDTKIAALDDEQAATALAIGEIRGQVAGYNQEIEEGNNEIIRILNQNSAHKEELSRYETIREQNAIKKAELSKRAIEHKSAESSADDELANCMQVWKDAEGEVYAQNEAIGALEEEIAKEGEGLLALGKELEEKQRGLIADSSRLESLRNITERYEGYGGAIRRIMEQKGRFLGIEGVVADLIKVDKDYETAVETALGGNIQNVVTENEQTAKELIGFLKQTKAGRATFLPLTSLNPAHNNNSAALREPGVIGLASSLVRAKKQYMVLVQFLLGRIFVVDTIDNALFLARKYNYTLRIVTLEGEQLNPGGSLSGGAYKNSGNLLARRREMEELSVRIKQAEQDVVGLEEKRAVKRSLRNALREKLEQEKAKLQEKITVQNGAKLNYRQAEEKKKRLSADFSRFLQELSGIDGQVMELEENIKRITGQYDENLVYRKQQEEHIEECQGLLKGKQQEEAQANEKLSSLKAELSAMEQNGANIMENIRRVRADVLRLTQEREELVNSADGFAISKKEKEEEIVKKRKENEGRRARIAELSKQVEQIGAATEEKKQVHKGFFERREELSARIAALDKELYRLEGQLAKLLEEEEARINYLWEEYGLTPSDAAGFFEEACQDSTGNKRRIAELKGKIKGLGDVNVNAIEDYKQVSERYGFLKAQRDDLHNSEETLLGIIAELDVEMRRQFAQKFAEITKQFDTVFKELFGGGKATLELAEDEDILTAGIRIIAQPPGKKLQNMMQLSGGEKALTAISLLFAIQNLKPSPFCLLDEIEAALDDSNVKRYAKYLHKLTKHTQFIVITHRRGTMAAADVLYGITMQEKGVSTLVSVSLIEGELEK